MSEYGYGENVIEFMKDAEFCYVTFSQKRYANRIMSLADKYPEEVEIISVNTKVNGDFESLYAKVPVSYIHISNQKRNLTDEQKAEMVANLRKANAD